MSSIYHHYTIHTIVNLLKCVNIYAGRTDGHTGEYMASGPVTSAIDTHKHIYIPSNEYMCTSLYMTDERGRFILYTQQHARIIIIQFSPFFFLGGGGGIDVFIAARSIRPFKFKNVFKDEPHITTVPAAASRVNIQSCATPVSPS